MSPIYTTWSRLRPKGVYCPASDVIVAAEKANVAPVAAQLAEANLASVLFWSKLIIRDDKNERLRDHV